MRGRGREKKIEEGNREGSGRNEGQASGREDKGFVWGDHGAYIGIHTIKT